MEERSENSKTTPTFIMAVLKLANDRWDGVPFIFKAGKGMNEKRSEIRVQLKESPGMFPRGGDLISITRRRAERVCFAHATERGDVHESDD